MVVELQGFHLQNRWDWEYSTVSKDKYWASVLLVLGCRLEAALMMSAGGKVLLLVCTL